MDSLPSDISVKSETKLLGSLKPEEYDQLFCATTSSLPSVTSNGGFSARTLSESVIESSLRTNPAESYESLFQLAEMGSSERRPFDIVARSEGVPVDCSVSSATYCYFGI